MHIDSINALDLKPGQKIRITLKGGCSASTRYCGVYAGTFDGCLITAGKPGAAHGLLLVSEIAWITAIDVNTTINPDDLEQDVD